MYEQTDKVYFRTDVDLFSDHKSNKARRFKIIYVHIGNFNVNCFSLLG